MLVVRGHLLHSSFQVVQVAGSDLQQHCQCSGTTEPVLQEGKRASFKVTDRLENVEALK